MKDEQYQAVMDELAALRKEVREGKPEFEWLQTVHQAYMGIWKDTGALHAQVEALFACFESLHEEKRQRAEVAGSVPAPPKPTLQ